MYFNTLIEKLKQKDIQMKFLLQYIKFYTILNSHF